MSLTTPRSRTIGAGLIGRIDDFMSWLLYGYETWLVAVLKGVPLFLFVYFLLAYVPNYVYYGFTQYIPFLRFTTQTGFIVASTTGGVNFLALVILVLWTQAARGRRGFAWTFIRVIDFLQMLFVYLVMIPWLAFNMAGGTLVPASGETWYGPVDTVAGISFPIAIVFGVVVAGLGAAALAFLYVEYRRVTHREAREAEARSAAYQAG
jgi:hypothetical protein